MALYAKGSPYTGAPFDMIRIFTGISARPGIVEPDAAPNYDEVKQQLGRNFLDE
jgi:hypothetical protein